MGAAGGGGEGRRAGAVCRVQAVVGRGLSGGRDGLWEEDGSARGSKKLLLKFRAQERDWERGRARPGGRSGCWLRGGFAEAGGQAVH